MRFRHHEILARHTSFKIGGTADLFFVAKTQKDLKKVVRWAKKTKTPYFILGGGSKILVSDQGFRGVVIKCQMSKIKYQRLNKFVLVEAESGVLVNRLVPDTLDKGLAGLEHFFGLPGTVGGAVHGRAHFQGHYFDENVLRINKIDEVILAVVFKLKPGNKEKLWRVAKEALRYRQMTQPLDLFSAGCIFKNPDSQLAGYLIEQCSLKGTKIGQAMISQKHANFIVNTKSASCQDVLKLIEICQKKVKEKFGIKLELEIVKVGEF